MLQHRVQAGLGAVDGAAALIDVSEFADGFVFGASVSRLQAEEAIMKQAQLPGVCIIRRKRHGFAFTLSLHGRALIEHHKIVLATSGPASLRGSINGDTGVSQYVSVQCH